MSLTVVRLKGSVLLEGSISVSTDTAVNLLHDIVVDPCMSMDDRIRSLEQLGMILEDPTMSISEHDVNDYTKEFCNG